MQWRILLSQFQLPLHLPTHYIVQLANSGWGCSFWSTKAFWRNLTWALLAITESFVIFPLLRVVVFGNSASDSLSVLHVLRRKVNYYPYVREPTQRLIIVPNYVLWGNNYGNSQLRPPTDMLCYLSWVGCFLVVLTTTWEAVVSYCH